MKEEHIEYISSVKESVCDIIKFLISDECSRKDDMKACVLLGELAESLSIFLEEVKFCEDPTEYEYELFVSCPRNGIHKIAAVKSKEEAHIWYSDSPKTRSYQVRKVND